MIHSLPSGEQRTWEQLREHYEVEKELATRLRTAPREQRRSLYSEVYDELYRRVPHHPRMTRRFSEDGGRAVAEQMALVQRFLTPQTVLLEVGPGDCSFSFAAARMVSKVYGLDVSAVAAQRPDAPANFELVIFDGCNIPLPPNNVTLAYSNSLMEHLHPDDALDQLRSIYRTLAPKGGYLCITPNRLYGPTDISKYFDTVPSGFHLKEYAAGELIRLMRQVGFRRILAYVGGRGFFLRSRLWPVLLTELGLRAFPRSAQHWLAGTLPVRGMLGIRLLAIK